MGHFERLRRWLLPILLCMLGCGRAAQNPETNLKGESPAVTAEQSRDAANARVRKAVQLAQVHLKHKEYDQAEKLLLEALSEAAATETSDAIAALDAVKTAKSTSGKVIGIVAPNRGPISPPQATQVPPHPFKASAPVTAVPAASVAIAPAPVQEPDEPAQQVIVVEIPDEESVEKVAATDAIIAELEAKARAAIQATSALRIYEKFLKRHTLTLAQEMKVNPQLEIWKDRAGKGLVRNGQAWVTAEIAQKNAEQSDQLIDQAIALLKVRDLKEATEALEKASRIDQNGIRADFMLGLMNSGVGASNPSTAEEHFRRVLNRSPRHISALNNMALTEIKLGKFAPALNHFTMASELAPRTPEVNQNLGRVVREASLKKLAVPDSLVTKFSKLYAEKTSSGRTQPSNPAMGWLYMPMYISENERQGKPDTSGEDELVLNSGGTGFVVHPGFVLTNRHVVDDDEFGTADTVRVVDPTDQNHQRELGARIVALSADLDLALVKCSALKAPPVRLSSELPRRGSDVLALGYPKFDLIGRGLKATRGIVTGLPEAANENMLMFDVEVNSGNSGGPILDKSGTAIAIATVKFNGANVGNYSGGIPAASALPFVKQLILAVESAPVGTAAELNWPEIDELVGPSTVMVLCYRSAVAVALNQDPDKGDALKGQRSSLHDASCSVCGGKGQLRCPNPKCVAGIMQVRQEYLVPVGNGELRTMVKRFRLVRDTCQACGGQSKIECGRCENGRDPSVTTP